jgi:hypothetical protein
LAKLKAGSLMVVLKKLGSAITDLIPIILVVVFFQLVFSTSGYPTTISEYW